MTERLPPAPDDDRDELASAYLDGEATPEETARVEADPALTARVAELRAVARAVADPATPPDDQARDQAIERAMAAFDDVARGTPVDLAAERRRRSRTRLWVASVAAAVLVALVAVPLLARTMGDGGTDTASQTADEDAVASDRQTTTAEESAGAGGGSDSEPEAAGNERPFLGSFADEEALLDGVSSAAFAPTNGDVSPLAAATPCPLPDSASDPVAVYDATLAGDPVTVVVFADPYSAQRVVVLDARCEALVDTTD
jgi:hypothetical protein